MAPGAGLTARQKQLLDLAIQEPYIIDTFYLSGGTALSYWYLHHRQSDDLDFFSLTPFDYDRLKRWFRQQEEILGYKEIRFDEDYGFMKVLVYFDDKYCLLLDFHHYTNMVLKQPNVWHGLKIDSIYDITVNKLDTISSLPRTRDYVDLFFICKKFSFKIDELLAKIPLKFKETIDPLTLAKNFLKVSEYVDFPKMLVPFNQKSMIEFYENLAKTLRPKILK